MGRPGVIRLKYVHAFRDRFGRMRYYFRRHGMRTALPGLPGSTEFMEVYAAGLASAKGRDGKIEGSSRNIRRTCPPIFWVRSISIIVSDEPCQL